MRKIKTMNKEQALQVIKQTLDLAIKAGIAQNLEQAALIAQAWTAILKELKENAEKQIYSPNI